MWSLTPHLLHVLLLFKPSSQFTVTLTSSLQCTSLPSHHHLIISPSHYPHLTLTPPHLTLTPPHTTSPHPHTTLTAPSHHLTSPSHNFTSPSHHHNPVPTKLCHSSACERHPHHWCAQFGCGARDSTAKSGCTGWWLRGPDGSAGPAWSQDQPRL